MWTKPQDSVHKPQFYHPYSIWSRQGSPLPPLSPPIACKHVEFAWRPLVHSSFVSMSGIRLHTFIAVLKRADWKSRLLSKTFILAIKNQPIILSINLFSKNCLLTLFIMVMIVMILMMMFVFLKCYLVFECTLVAVAFSSLARFLGEVLSVHSPPALFLFVCLLLFSFSRD